MPNLNNLGIGRIIFVVGAIIGIAQIQTLSGQKCHDNSDYGFPNQKTL